MKNWQETVASNKTATNTPKYESTEQGPVAHIYNFGVNFNIQKKTIELVHTCNLR